ncbi:hypothetical protein F5051DRAFT_391578 [Lentinula edodes]|nr:hypothetical protein F5051DRAFT_391578 [Lentinula edodes]
MLIHTAFFYNPPDISVYSFICISIRLLAFSISHWIAYTPSFLIPSIVESDTNPNLIYTSSRHLQVVFSEGFSYIPGSNNSCYFLATYLLRILCTYLPVLPLVLILNRNSF